MDGRQALAGHSLRSRRRPILRESDKQCAFCRHKKETTAHSLCLGGSSSLRTIQLDVPISVTSDIDGVDPTDRILVGIKYGMAILDRKAGSYELLGGFHEPSNERLRSNDGASDPNGRFWLGSMTDFGLGPFKQRVCSRRTHHRDSKDDPLMLQAGAYYCFHPGHREEVFPDLTIPNSIGWSPDQRTMYFTHSSARQVFALDYEPATGAFSNQRLFYQHEGPGEPDGFRVDVNGNLWHAVYGESCVLKLSPGGKLVGKVHLPTRNITCVQFVNTELVITSAADEEGEGKSKEFGGAVFRVDVGTTGLDLFNYKM